MTIERKSAFTLSDLAKFDDTRLREVICERSGAAHPAQVGMAIGGEQRDGALARLADRIERALAPASRETFVRARWSAATDQERAAANDAVLNCLAWDLTYWKTPDEYERLTAGEQVHLGALDFARLDGGVALDAGCGSGRITFPLARRARRTYAMDPAPPLLHMLESKLAAANMPQVEILRAEFSRISLPDDSVDAAICCSSFGPLEARGGVSGLHELQRVTRPGGRIVIIWPEDPDWFLRQGFHYTILPGRLTITFASLDEACAVARRFYGETALRYLEATGQPELPYHILKLRAPRDLCWLTVQK
ncbi:MAG TPA: class I SAM-dependent methyltransferase [Ktedonobacterales bacterium]